MAVSKRRLARGNGDVYPPVIAADRKSALNRGCWRGQPAARAVLRRPCQAEVELAGSARTVVLCLAGFQCKGGIQTLRWRPRHGGVQPGRLLFAAPFPRRRPLRPCSHLTSDPIMSLLSATPDTRYADSLRLSVAPMMDWVDDENKIL